MSHHVLPSPWFICLLNQKPKHPLFIKSLYETLGIVWIRAGTEIFRLDPLLRDLIKAKLGSCDGVRTRPLLLRCNPFLSISVTPWLSTGNYAKVQHAKLSIRSFPPSFCFHPVMSAGKWWWHKSACQTSPPPHASSTFSIIVDGCSGLITRVPESDWHGRGSAELRNPNRSVCWTKR